MSDYISDPLLALIRERGLIDDLQLEEVSQEQSRTGKPFSQVLADLGFVDMETQLQVMADHLGTEVVNIEGTEFTPQLVKTISPGSHPSSPATRSRAWSIACRTWRPNV